ncbi:MAG: hypothetical protein QXX01_03225 [Candidatus Aenigmatarchaeota archaeon]
MKKESKEIKKIAKDLKSLGLIENTNIVINAYKKSDMTEEEFIENLEIGIVVLYKKFIDNINEYINQLSKIKILNY